MGALGSELQEADTDSASAHSTEVLRESVRKPASVMTGSKEVSFKHRHVEMDSQGV